MIQRLDLKGCTVRGDALNTQKKVARSILDHAEGYVMTLKQNHATLHTDTVLTFAEADDAPSRVARDEHTTMSKGHAGRPRLWRAAAFISRCFGTVSIVALKSYIDTPSGEREPGRPAEQYNHLFTTYASIKRLTI